MKKEDFFKYLTIFLAITVVVVGRFFYIKQATKNKYFGHIKTYNMDFYAQNETKIVNVFVKEGEFVKKDQPIIRLKSDLLKAQKEHLLAKIKQQKVKVDLFKFKENKALEDYVLVKKNNLNTDEIHLKLKFLEEKQLEFRIQDSILDTLQKEIQCLNKQIEEFTILAPFDGKITKLFVEPSQYVKNQNDLFNISMPDKLWIEAKIKPEELQNFQINDIMQAKIASYSSKIFDAEIFEIGNYIERSKNQEAYIPIKLKINQNKTSNLENSISLLDGMKVKLKRKNGHN